MPATASRTVALSAVDLALGVTVLGGQVAARAARRADQAVRVRVNAALDQAVPAVVDAVLDRIDLTGLFLTRVDVIRIVRRVDIEAVVAELDLAAITNQVITEVDLPELIRESSGALASESVIGVRSQSLEADEWVNRVVDRILQRRGSRRESGLTVPPSGD